MIAVNNDQSSASQSPASQRVCGKLVQAAAIVLSNNGDLWTSARLPRLPVTRKMSDGRDTLAGVRPHNGQVCLVSSGLLVSRLMGVGMSMTLRRDGRVGSDGGGAVEAFWRWWASAGRLAAEAGIGGAGFEGFTGQMTARVNAMHPDLAWELAPGAKAEHALVVTAAGVPALRRLAERWYQHAPPVSAVWEYHPARQASPSSLAAVLEIGGHRLSLDKLIFDLHVDNDRDVIDTVVFHPSFARMPSDARNQVGFLALDWALGEDGVTRWIGGFETSGTCPPAGVPAGGLIETVEALAGRAGHPRWALLRGEREGAVVLAALAVPAKWVDHPLMDLHLAVTLPFAGQTPEGLPGPGLLDQLRAVEGELTDRLEPRALLVAHETTRGVRTLHLYADSDDSAVAEQAREAVAGWPGAAVNATVDVGWRAVRHLTE